LASAEAKKSGGKKKQCEAKQNKAKGKEQSTSAVKKINLHKD
jgi:hypothetical protein